MKRLALWQRLSLVFCALLLVCCGALAWIQMRSTRLHEQETVQRLSRGLAEHIARSGELMDARGMRDGEVRALFGKLMAVNPSVEVYLLDDQGRILGHDAPDGHLRRDRVDLAPVHALLGGAPLPILGDDPRSSTGRKVFNAAPLRVQGKQVGYIYVVLVGEQREALAADVAASASLRTTLWALAIVAAVGLLAGGSGSLGLIDQSLLRGGLGHGGAGGDAKGGHSGHGDEEFAISHVKAPFRIRTGWGFRGAGSAVPGPA